MIQPKHVGFRIVALFGFVCVLLGSPGAGHSQDGNVAAFFRKLELPRHQRLIEQMSEPGSELAPFATDGCSGGLSQAWQDIATHIPAFKDAHQSAPPWESCCVTHDQAYHNAGGATDAASSYAARLDADHDLQTCVAATGQLRAEALAQQYQMRPAQVDAAYARIGAAMFRAVRAGGGPCTGLPWRWGYGYQGCSLLERMFE